MRVNTSDLGNEAITRYNGVQQCFVFSVLGGYKLSCGRQPGLFLTEGFKASSGLHTLQAIFFVFTLAIPLALVVCLLMMVCNDLTSGLQIMKKDGACLRAKLTAAVQGRNVLCRAEMSCAGQKYLVKGRNVLFISHGHSMTDFLWKSGWECHLVFMGVAWAVCSAVRQVLFLQLFWTSPIWSSATMIWQHESSYFFDNKLTSRWL